MAIVATPAVATPGAETCDTEIVRTQAGRDVPDYRLAAVRVHDGIVTLSFTTNDGSGNWAIALHAAGTQLSTSVMGTGLDAAELARASEPLNGWWQLAEVQQALVGCGRSSSDVDLGDPTTLHAAAEAALPNRASRSNWDETWPLSYLATRVRWIDVGDFFFLVLIAGVLGALWGCRRRLRNPDAAAIVMLTALALLLRFIAHPGPADIREVLSETGVRRAGWAALLHAIFSIFPMRDETVWTINRIVGALSVPLLFVVMRRRFPDRIAAIAGAAALAVTPLIVRFSASDTPYIMQCAALLGAVLAYDRYVANGSTGTALLGLGLLTAAMQLRPEGPWLAVPAALIALSAGLPPDWTVRLRRPWIVLSVLLFLGVNAICTAWALGTDNGHSLSGFVLAGAVFGSPWADPSSTPTMLAALVVLGAASAILHRRAGLLWLGAALIAVPFYFPVTVKTVVPVDGRFALTELPEYAVARYHLPAMYLACGLIGLAVATVLAGIGRVSRRTLPAASAVAVGIVCAAAVPRLDLLWRMWTPQMEFEFFRDGLTRVDPRCEVVTMLDVRDAGFVPFRYLRPGMIDAETFLSSPPAGDCFVYYRGSNCYELDLVAEDDRQSFTANPTCRAIEERYKLDPIVEAQLPAVPYRAEMYARDPLPVGFFRLEGVDRVAGAGSHDDRGQPSRSPWKAAMLLGFVAVAAVLADREGSPPSDASGRAGDDAARTKHVAWLAAALGTIGLFLFDVSTTVTFALGAAWIAFAVLLIDRASFAADGLVQRRSLLVLFGVSVLLHWTLSSGGPGDLKLNLAAIWSDSSSGLELRWGPAPIALFRLLGVVLLGMNDSKILWCNLVLGSVVPVLLYAILLRLGIRERAALAAALLVAAHPLLIAVSGVLDRQPTYLFAATGSLLALLGFLEDGGRRRLAAVVLGAMLATASRPEGAHLFVVLAAALAFVPATLRRRGVAAVALLLAAMVASVYVRYGIEYGGGLAGRTAMASAVFDPGPLLWTVVFDPHFTPLAWIAAWTGGLVFGVRRRAAWIAIAAVAGIHLVWGWTGLYDNFVGYDRQVASARYETILLIPFAIGSALAVDRLLSAPAVSRVPLAVVAVALSAATFRHPYDTLLRPFTIDYEFHFLKKHALTLPLESRLYVLDPPIDDVGFVDAAAVGEFVRSTVNFTRWSDRRCDSVREGDADTYLYIGSSCAPLLEQPRRPMTSDGVRGAALYHQWLEDCAAIRAGVAGGAVEEIDVPAHKMSWYDFRDRTVRLGLYRLTAPSLCAIGWRVSARNESG